MFSCCDERLLVLKPVPDGGVALQLYWVSEVPVPDVVILILLLSGSGDGDVLNPVSIDGGALDLH